MQIEKSGSDVRKLLATLVIGLFLVAAIAAGWRIASQTPVVGAIPLALTNTLSQTADAPISLPETPTPAVTWDQVNAERQRNADAAARENAAAYARDAQARALADADLSNRLAVANAIRAEMAARDARQAARAERWFEKNAAEVNAALNQNSGAPKKVVTSVTK